MAESSPFSRGEDKAAESGAQFLEKIVKVIKHVQLYPPEHPYIKQGMDEIMKVMGDIFVGLSEFSVGASEDSLLFEKKPVETSPQTKKEIFRMLNRTNLASFTFASRITVPELLEFVKIMATKPDEIKAGGGAEKMLAEATENIKVDASDSKRKTGTMQLLSGEESDLLSDKMQTSVLTSYLAKKLRQKAEPEKPVIAEEEEDMGDETRTMKPMLDPLATNPELIASTVTDAVREKLSENGEADEEATKEATMQSLDRVARMFSRESTSWLSSKDLLIKVILMLDEDLRKALLGESEPGTVDVDMLVDKLSLEARSDMLVRELKAGRLGGEQLRKALENLSKNEEDREELIRQVHVAVEHGEFEPGTRTVILENLDGISAIARGEVAEVEEEEDIPPPSRPPMKIFVADREKEVRTKLKDLLGMDRHSIRTTNSGDELLNWLQEEKPDLIIMDVKLEEKHGLEVLEDLKRRRMDHIPVVVYSEMAKPDFEPAVQRYARLEWITKNMSVEEFAGQINLYQSAPRVWLFGTAGQRRMDVAEALPDESNVMVSEFDTLFDLAHDLATELPDCLVLSVVAAGAHMVKFIEFLRSKPACRNTPIFLIDADRTQSSLRPLLAFKHLRFIPGGLRPSDIASRVIELLGRSQAEHGLQPHR